MRDGQITEASDDENQRQLSESLGVNDENFNENLRQLYDKRIQSSSKLLDQLSLELEKSSNTQLFL